MNWTILRRAGMTTTADEFEDARIEVTEAGVLIVRQQGMNAPHAWSPVAFYSRDQWYKVSQRCLGNSAR